MIDRALGCSGLRYYGTETDVRLGDRVRVRRGWFSGGFNAVVCYIPGVSEFHPDFEDRRGQDPGGIKQWALRASDGAIYPMIYWPEKHQPLKRIEFVSRGQGGEVSPNEVVDAFGEVGAGEEK